MNWLPPFCLLIILLLACNKKEITPATPAATFFDMPLVNAINIYESLIKKPTTLEQQMISKGLKNIKEVDSTIQLNIKYSTTDNLTGKDMYGWYSKCYLLPEVAEKLGKAQQYLKERDSTLSLVVFDCARPLAAQFIIWNSLKGTDKRAYVAYPAGGSLHNYGAAVDAGLFSSKTGLVDMGTKFDLMEPVAQPRHEQKFLREGKLTEEHIKNRQLLRSVMRKAGFINIQTEWWHFNAMTIQKARANYQIIE